MARESSRTGNDSDNRRRRVQWKLLARTSHTTQQGPMRPACPWPPRLLQPCPSTARAGRPPPHQQTSHLPSWSPQVRPGTPPIRTLQRLCADLHHACQACRVLRPRLLRSLPSQQPPQVLTRLLLSCSHVLCATRLHLGMTRHRPMCLSCPAPSPSNSISSDSSSSRSSCRIGQTPAGRPPTAVDGLHRGVAAARPSLRPSCRHMGAARARAAGRAWGPAHSAREGLRAEETRPQSSKASSRLCGRSFRWRQRQEAVRAGGEGVQQERVAGLGVGANRGG